MKPFQASCLLVFALFISLEANAAIYKCVDADGRITYTLKKKEDCPKLNLLDPRWVLLNENVFSKEELYYDSQSVVRTNNMVKVWTLKQEDGPSTKELFTIDCSARTYKKLQSDRRSASTLNQIMNIAPESDIEMVYSKLCTGN